MSQITTWQIEKWKAERRRNVKPGTVNRQLSVIKHMFRKAVDWGLTTSNPATGVKRFSVNDQRTRFLTEDEIPRLLEVCEEHITSPWLLPLVTLTLHTGLRQGELLRLRWEDVDLERGLVTVNQSKNHRLKTVAINEPARGALEWLLQHRYRDYLFMWPWGDFIGKTTVYDVFKRACSEAGIEEFRFHGLRHTFASYLVMAVVDLVTVKELMGYVGINMTLRYAYLAPEHKAQAVAKLNERFQGVKGGTESQAVMVSQELREVIGSDSTPNLARSRNVYLVRRGRGLGFAKEINEDVEAAGGFEPPHRGFADLSLNHLGTPPRFHI